MTAPNFADILEMDSSIIEKPKPYPVGMYLGMVAGVPEFKELGKDNSPAAVVQIRLVRAMDGVDAEALAAAGGLNERSIIRRTLWLSSDPISREMYAVRTFCEDCGIDVENKKLKEMFSELPNRQVYVTIRHNPSKDGKDLFPEIASTAKV